MLINKRALILEWQFPLFPHLNDIPFQVSSKLDLYTTSYSQKEILKNLLAN